MASSTFLLVVAGGLVTSTGSALAVPDWPLAFGQWFPKMEGGVLYEHGHRLIAATVGLLTLILAGWLWRADRSSGVRYLGFAAVGMVLIQGILGGMTVLYRLPVPVSVGHACLGQLFFTTMVCIAVLTGSPATRPAGGKMTKLQRLGLLTVGFVFLQLIFGAYLRHTGKGLHWHFLGAMLVTIHVPLLARRIFKEMRGRTGLTRIAAGLPVLLSIQLALGYFSWKTGPVLATTAHVAIGALMLAGTVVLTLQAFRQQEQP